MPPVKHVLIIEDRPKMANAIAEGLARRTDYAFRVDVALSPEEYLEKCLDEKRYDAAIVDLHLIETKPNRLLFGHRICEAFTVESPYTLQVVYSAFDDVDNVSQAVRRGAGVFISKNKCRPHELAQRLCDLLSSQELVLRTLEELDNFIESHWDEMSLRYSGQVVALVNRSVVASGRNRIEAYCNYETEGEGKDWPVNPELVKIP